MTSSGTGGGSVRHTLVRSGPTLFGNILKNKGIAFFPALSPCGKVRYNPGTICGPGWGPMRGKLSDRKVQTAKPGKYGDGGNLYLIVSKTGARKWVFRFQWQGNAKERGLGSASDVPLAEARVRAGAARFLLAQGINPIEAAKQERVLPTFGAMADEVCETLASGFRNEKHRAMEIYAANACRSIERPFY